MESRVKVGSSPQYVFFASHITSTPGAALSWPHAFGDADGHVSACHWSLHLSRSGLLILIARQRAQGMSSCTCCWGKRWFVAWCACPVFRLAFLSRDCLVRTRC
jgi:hypothetical protein